MSSINKHITILKLGIDHLEQFIATIRLFEDVFKMENFSIPAVQHLQQLLQKKDFLIFAALKGNHVVGGLTGYVLEQYYSEKQLAYIYDLAVDTQHQRRGIGKRLIDEMNRYGEQNGFEEVFVQADKVDDYALDFYRATQPTSEERVVHFCYALDSKK